MTHCAHPPCHKPARRAHLSLMGFHILRSMSATLVAFLMVMCATPAGAAVQVDCSRIVEVGNGCWDGTNVCLGCCTTVNRCRSHSRSTSFLDSCEDIAFGSPPYKRCHWIGEKCSYRGTAYSLFGDMPDYCMPAPPPPPYSPPPPPSPPSPFPPPPPPRSPPSPPTLDDADLFFIFIVVPLAVAVIGTLGGVYGCYRCKSCCFKGRRTPPEPMTQPPLGLIGIPTSQPVMGKQAQVVSKAV